VERIATFAMYHTWTLERRQCHIATCSSVQSPLTRYGTGREVVEVIYRRQVPSVDRAGGALYARKRWHWESSSGFTERKAGRKEEARE
jgi:hypothetical protein